MIIDKRDKSNNSRLYITLWSSATFALVVISLSLSCAIHARCMHRSFHCAERTLRMKFDLQLIISIEEKRLRSNHVHRVTRQVFHLAPLWCLFWRWTVVSPPFRHLRDSDCEQRDERGQKGARRCSIVPCFRVVWEPRLATGAFHLLFARFFPFVRFAAKTGTQSSRMLLKHFVPWREMFRISSIRAFISRCNTAFRNW